MRANALQTDPWRPDLSGGLGQTDAAFGRRTRISKLRAFGLVLPGLLLMDAVLVAGAFFAALQFTPGARAAVASPAPQVTLPLIALFVVLAVSFLFLGGMFGLYSRRLLLRPRRALATAARALFWSGVIAVVFDFLLALDPPGDLRRLLLTHALILTGGVLSLRPLWSRLILRFAEVGSVRPRRVLLVGGRPEARRAAAVIEGEAPREATVVGLADTHPLPKGPGQRWPRFQLESWEDLPGLASALAVDEVLIAADSLDRGSAVRQSAAMARQGIETHVIPHLTRMYVDAAPIQREAGVPLLRLSAPAQASLGLIVKRAFDLTVTIAMGLVLMPLMLIIALLVKLSSSGPILYGQERVGRGGEVFRMYKFRSMVASNDDSGHRRYVASLLRGGDAAGVDPSGRPVYKLMDDPRITFVGRFLRRTSLDELPQLINVLRGEMSLIGPRPCLPFEYELYEDWHKKRLDVTPGMTGLWQVSGRSLLSFEEMVLLDLYYGANWSFGLDLRLLWRTIPEVIYARGAR